MLYYLDSSVLVKSFVREAGSPRVRELTRSKPVATCALASVEIRSAVARAVRDGRLSDDDAARIEARLVRLWSRMTVVEPRGRTLALAGELVGRRALRAYDAVHLASALRLASDAGVAVTFGCADEALRAAASAEGLRLLA